MKHERFYKDAFGKIVYNNVVLNTGDPLNISMLTNYETGYIGRSGL